MILVTVQFHFNWFNDRAISMAYTTCLDPFSQSDQQGYPPFPRYRTKLFSMPIPRLKFLKDALPRAEFPLGKGREELERLDYSFLSCSQLRFLNE